MFIPTRKTHWFLVSPGSPHITPKLIGPTAESWRLHCSKICLRSALPEKLDPEPVSTPAPDVSNVPKVYHDRHQAFRKDLTLSLPPYRPYDSTIDLLPSPPLLSGGFYNLSVKKREAIKRYNQESLEAGIIRPSTSPLGAGFVFVAKKDGSLFSCIDYQGLNLITVKNKYSLPLLSSALESVRRASVFSQLDPRNTYHLVREMNGKPPSRLPLVILSIW